MVTENLILTALNQAGLRWEKIFGCQKNNNNIDETR